MNENINTQRIAIMEQRLSEAFDPQHLEIFDDSDQHIGHAGAASGAGHFTVMIRSSNFAGKTRLQAHKMIYHVLADMMESDIHALKIKIM